MTDIEKAVMHAEIEALLAGRDRRDARIAELEHEIEGLRGKIRDWVMVDGVTHSYCSCGHCRALQVADNESKP